MKVYQFDMDYHDRKTIFFYHMYDKKLKYNIKTIS